MDSTGLLHKEVNCVSQDAGPMCGSVYLGSHSHSPFFIPLSFLCLTSISLVDQTSRCLSQCHLKFKPRSVTDSFLSLYIFFQTGPKYDLQRLRQWMDDESFRLNLHMQENSLFISDYQSTQHYLKCLLDFSGALISNISN